MLKKFTITHKKLTYHYTKLDVEKAKNFAKETKFLLSLSPFLAIDECSFYPNADPRFGYSLKGKRAVSKRPSSKGKHYTLLFCIKNSKGKGIIHYLLTKDRVNYQVFYDFLEGISLSSNEKHYLLMDNARIHTAPKKRAEAKLPSIQEQLSRKNMEARFITTYAPMLNPVELVFCLLRLQTEKQRPRNYEELKSAIEKVIKLINQKDLNKYFQHCMDYDFDGDHQGSNDNKDATHSV